MKGIITRWWNVRPATRYETFLVVGRQKLDPAEEVVSKIDVSDKLARELGKKHISTIILSDRDTLAAILLSHRKCGDPFSDEAEKEMYEAAGVAALLDDPSVKRPEFPWVKG